MMSQPAALREATMLEAHAAALLKKALTRLGIVGEVGKQDPVGAQTCSP